MTNYLHFMYFTKIKRLFKICKIIHFFLHYNEVESGKRNNRPQLWELISSCTKAALAAKKKKGHKLGKPENLTQEAARKGELCSFLKVFYQKISFCCDFYSVIKLYAK